MQISKLVTVLCAAGAILPLATRALDNDAQAKARALLRQTRIEPAESPVLAPAQPVRRAPVARPAPAVADTDAVARAREAMRRKLAEAEAADGVTPPPIVPAPVVATPPPARVIPIPARSLRVPSEADSKLREALRRRMAEVEAEAPAATPAMAAPAPASAPVVSAPAHRPRSSETADQTTAALRRTMSEMAEREAAEGRRQQASAEIVNLPPAPNPEAVAKATAALREKERALAVDQARQAAQAEALGIAPHKSPYPPLSGPEPAISAEKDQRLERLLRAYQQDQISPEQYHEQRAKILAE